MMLKHEVNEWLATLPEDSVLAIGEDGLTLETNNGEYLEIGMFPLDDDEGGNEAGS